MNFLQWLASPITAIVNGVSGYMQNKQEIKAREQERKDRVQEAQTQANIRRIEAGERFDGDLDLYFIKNNGWKDDISFYIFLAPAVLAFIPQMVPHIEAGFNVLENMPIMYQVCLGMMLIAVWGYRRMLRPAIQAIMKRKLGIV